MNVTVQNVYQDKAEVGKLENFDTLIDIMKKNMPNLGIVDNHDRTISIQCDEHYGTYQSTFEKSIFKWTAKSHVKLNTAPIHVFNVLPLTPQHVLIKV